MHGTEIEGFGVHVHVDEDVPLRSPGPDVLILFLGFHVVLDTSTINQSHARGKQVNACKRRSSKAPRLGDSLPCFITISGLCAACYATNSSHAHADPEHLGVCCPCEDAKMQCYNMFGRGAHYACSQVLHATW